jgi:LuxR family maltose regulon positive regulatory protein
MTGMPQASSEAVLTSLINELDAISGGIVLVLDDYQFIDSQAVHEQVSFLLEHCPESLHVVIVTRSDPPLPLARLRARCQMFEFRAGDLCFTGLETAQFLDDVMGLHLDGESVSVLEERTEGWIAGLQMAALSMRNCEDITRFIQAFSGSNRYIMDYLLEEVLASQPPDIQRFLLYTSIVESLTAPLCDVLLNDEGKKMKDMAEEPSFSPSTSLSARPYPSSLILEFLERANLFLMPLDDERVWFRYHHLFADLLRVRLDQIYPGLSFQLHARAAAWYEKNGLILDAIRHASMVPDDEMVECLIKQNYLEMMNRDEMASVRFWMGNLSKELIYRRPWLCLYEAMNRSWFGQLNEANVLLDEAEKRIRSEDSATSRQSMLGYHAYVKSRVTAMQGDTRKAIEFCISARENTPVDSLELQIDFGITLGYEYFLYGDFTNSSMILNEIIQSGYRARAVNNPVAAYCLLARSQMIQGRLHEVDELLQKGLLLLHEPGGEYLGVMGLIDVETAALLCEWNQLDAALDCLKKGLDLLPLWGKTDDFCLAYITLSKIQLAQGNGIHATGAVEKAIRLIQTCGVFSEARSVVEAAQVKLWLAQGNWLAVNRWVATLDLHFTSQDPFRYEHELTHITQARVFIAQNKQEEAIRLLSSLEESAQSGGRQGRLIEILILKSLALQGIRNYAQADVALTKCLTLAKPGGFMRIFLDEGQPMRLLLAQWLAHAGASPLRDYAVRLLLAFDTELPVAAGPKKKASPAGGASARLCQPGEALVEPLSQRELEVLHLLALGRTNQEIAQQLVVASGTVKAHLANIYRKLDVANRTEAVARARQLSILP